MRSIFSVFLVVIGTLVMAQSHVQNQLIVQLQHKESISIMAKEATQILPNAEFTILQPLSKSLNIWLVGYNESAVNSDKAIDVLENLQSITLAQVNHNTIENRGQPDDASFGQQWCHFNSNDFDMDSDEAWDVTTGGVTDLGDTIVVAVIDGGADLTHEDLDYWRNYLEIPGDGIDNDNNGYIDDYNGWHVYSSGGTVYEDEDVSSAGSWDEHGIHVSGIVGAKGNNGIGVVGVNWNIKVMAVRGSSTEEAVLIKSYGYVYDQRMIYNRSEGDSGAFVVATNSSFGVNYGDPADYPIWCGLYDALGSVGIISAVAGPNLGINIDVEGDIPGTCPSNYTISTTNSRDNDTRNSGAGYGPIHCDIAAPGTDIYSTTGNSGYGTKTGTSMATPQVAGAVGLMYSSVCAEMFSNYNSAGLAYQIREYMLTDGFDTISSMLGESVTGGRLNLSRCIAAVASNICMLNLPGDINGNGIIDAGEIVGDINNDGVISTGEIAGDVNGNGIIDFPEITGDVDGDGVINDGEIAGDANGNGVIDGSETTGLSIYKTELSDFKISPNPANDILIVSISEEQRNLKLYSILGELILTKELHYTTRIDVSNIDSGIYFVVVSNGKTEETKRVVITH
ncbi:MAG: S8 family serine peptidase [Flavobacteriales bacterium]|nr:S8 family serine peptidase [Flavobacteriales bacterium]